VISEGIKENPEEGFLYYNRACFWVHLDSFREALSDVEKAIELNDFFEEYMREDEELNPIRILPEYKSRFE
jgi:hypothetical protein